MQANQTYWQMELLRAFPPLVQQDHLQEALPALLYQLQDQPQKAMAGNFLMQALWKFQSNELKEILKSS